MSSLDFKKLSLYHYDIIKPFLAENKNRFNDWSVGGIFLWLDYGDVYYAIYENNLILKTRYYDNYPTFALKNESLNDSVLEVIKNYAKKENIKLIFTSLDLEGATFIQNKFNNVSISSNRDYADYLYNIEDLKTFSGKKYQSQRNNINYFINTYKPIVKEFKIEDLDLILEFLDRYYQDFQNQDEYFQIEKKYVYDSFINFDKYPFKAIYVLVDFKVVGVCSGEIVKDTAYQHIEKGFKEFEGIYPFLTKIFANSINDDCVRYINREDDNGDLGLRYSKEKYRPIALLEKYMVEVKND